jgi:hypothetical protein
MDPFTILRSGQRQATKDRFDEPSINKPASHEITPGTETGGYTLIGSRWQGNSFASFPGPEVDESENEWG